MTDSIALVLAGGGARGAYEIGALSVLLPWLEQEHGQRPNVLVAQRGGANAAYIAAHANESTAELVEEGCEIWRRIGYRDVLDPILSIGQLTTVGRLALASYSPASPIQPARSGTARCDAGEADHLRGHPQQRR